MHWDSCCCLQSYCTSFCRVTRTSQPHVCNFVPFLFRFYIYHHKAQDDKMNGPLNKMPYASFFSQPESPQNSTLEAVDASHPLVQTPGNPNHAGLLANTSTNSSPSNPRSSASIDLDTYLQHRDQQPYQMPEPSYLVSAYRRDQDAMASYRKPGLKRDLECR